ncbi:MAG: molybdopterin-dependent oxidoreductase [Methanobacteriaceae archaeon]
MKKIYLIVVLSVVVLGVFLALENFQNRTVSLDSAEVREYQGQDLSSVSDFRENSIKGPQYVDINSYHLEITGLVQRPVNYTYDEVKNFTTYRKVVKLDCVEGWSVNILWEGVLVSDLINKAGPLPQANTIIFHAVDGYTTSFPLDYVKNNQILLAYKMNNATIPPERGYPFQLVAESKWGYKWIKWVDKIELSDDPNYKGYWESRGYSNSGNLSEYFLG